MTDADVNEFGSPAEATPEPSSVPFPRMRPSAKLREMWAAALEKANEAQKTRHVLPSPLAVVPSLIRKRQMPAMWWPAQWQNIARRCRTYVGECVAVTGPIGGGKTSFAIQCAIANAGHGHPIIWAPLELDPEQVDLRVVANMHGVHMAAVREDWPEERIAHSLTAIDDMWHYVDEYDDPDQQFAAIEHAILMAWEVYRVPPFVVVDHLGELVAEERDDRAALRRWARRFRRLALRTNSFIMLLNQVSKSNQAATTGKTDFESAADAMAIEMSSQAVASACSNSLVLTVFKVDDAPELDSHVLVPKARNTGREGREGFLFRKPGGVWVERDYLPATPSQVKADAEKDKKDKHRIALPRTTSQVRDDINASKAGDAAAMRRAKIVEALHRHGMLGIELHELKKTFGVGRGALFAQALQELERAGSAERIGTRVRMIARMQ